MSARLFVPLLSLSLLARSSFGMQINSQENRLEVCLKVFRTRCPTQAGRARENCLMEVGYAGNCLVRHAKTAPEAFSAIVSRLKDRDPEVRATSVAVLGDLGPAAKETVPALVEALKDKHGRIAEFAAKSLASIGPDAIPALVKALPVLPTPTSRVAQGWAGAALGYIGKPALPALIEALKDPALRFAAMRGLERMEPDVREAVPALTAALTDRDPFVRADVARILAKVGPGAAEAVPALVKMLEDPDFESRINAIYTLGAMGPGAASALPALRRIVSDNRIGSSNDNDRIKSAANGAIKKIEGKISPRK